jgi:hypothetical protein
MTWVLEIANPAGRDRKRDSMDSHMILYRRRDQEGL